MPAPSPSPFRLCISRFALPLAPIFLACSLLRPRRPRAVFARQGARAPRSAFTHPVKVPHAPPATLVPTPVFKTALMYSHRHHLHTSPPPPASHSSSPARPTLARMSLQRMHARALLSLSAPKRFTSL